MKSYLSFFYCSLCLFLVLSCDQDSEDNNSTSSIYLKTFKNESTTYKFKYDKNNQLSSVDYASIDANGSYQINKYDGKGNIIEFVNRVNAGKNVRIIKSLYDNQNRVIEIMTFDSIGDTKIILATVESFQYSTNNTVVETRNQKGTLFARLEIIYDNGNKVEEKFYNLGGIATGIPSSIYSYSSYDVNPTPESLMPIFLAKTKSRNNYLDFKYAFSGGAPTSASVSHNYNKEGYPTETIFKTNLATTTYVYEYGSR